MTIFIMLIGIALLVVEGPHEKVFDHFLLSHKMIKC